MKNTGINRKVDELGRVVIPVELLRTLNIKHKDPLAFFVDEETIILQKYNSDCYLCHEASNLKWFKGKYICQGCIDHIKDIQNSTIEETEND